MRIARLILAFVLALAGTAPLGATLAERSPFVQGHWWDSSRSGHGFDLYTVGDQVVATWYTYAANGRPIWYTAQGNVADLGARSWPLLQHRWANGRKADGTVVGSLRLTRRHAESLDVAWSIGGGGSGTWTVQPFVISGVTNEVDHSGAWFDPSNPGWGLTILEQGDALGSVLFAYDTNGAPTWAAGFGREPGAVELFEFEGTCPYCSARTPLSRSVGKLGLQFARETQARARNVSLTLATAPGVAIDNANLVQMSRAASIRAADRQLASFVSGVDLRAYLEAGMSNIAPTTGGVDASSAPFASASPLEPGVEEATLATSDGRYAYTFAYSSTTRRPVIRTAQVIANGATMAPRNTVTLASGSATPVDSAGLFISGDDLVSVVGTRPSGSFTSWISSGAWTRGMTFVEVLSLAVPDQPVTRWRVQLDGHLVASRRVGNRLYLVTRFVPFITGFVHGTSFPPAVANNQALLASTPIQVFLPNYAIGGSIPFDAVNPASIFVPPRGARGPVADMIVVTAISLAVPEVAQSLVVMGPIEAIHASADNLYLATARTPMRTPEGTLLPVEPASYVTDIHQVKLGAEAMSIVGTGSIEGYLATDPDQLPSRLSEYQGRLRTVSSSNTWWSPQNRNRLTVLEPSSIAPGLLKTVSYLPNATRTQTLGEAGQTLEGTRFVNDRLYASAAGQTGPLYVVDLANSSDPKVTAQLQSPGFAEFLHPIANGLLLAFGREVTSTGQVQGLQLSLFDIANASQPREVRRIVLGRRGSESALLRHPHAFSFREQADGATLIAFPARIHDGGAVASPSFAYPWVESGLMRFEVRGSGTTARLTELQRIVSHRARDGALSYFEDPAADGGRSILFRFGATYVGNGLWWHQDILGNGFGPF